MQKRYTALKNKKRLSLREQTEIENIILDVQIKESICRDDAQEWLDKGIIEY